MKRLIPISCVFLPMFFTPLWAQVDTTAADKAAPDTSAIPVDFSLRGGFYYQPGVRGTVDGPDYFHETQEFYQGLNGSYPWRDPDNGRTDNPLFHGAGYIRLDAVAEPIPEARLQAGLIGEMRGMSYGVRDVRNMIVYPEFLFSFNYTLPLLGDTLHFRNRVGDRPQFESLMPLTFYNLDVQGSEFQVGYRWLELVYEKAAGDAAFAVGLNINDADHLAIRTRGIRVLDSTELLVQATRFSYPTIYYLSSTSSYFNLTYPSFIDDSPRDRLYREANPDESGYSLLARFGRELSPEARGDVTFSWAVRNGAALLDHFMSQSAFLARLRLEGEWKEGEFTAEGAYRYYGGLFNAGFRNDSPSYREEAEADERDDRFDSDWRSTYANSIGPYLYPLSNLDYPFSRWAVFTEYQDLKDVTGWTLYGRGRWRVVDRFFVGGMIDLNLIVPEKTDSRLYPFFAVGVGYEPYPSITASIDVTNRTMNLDRHYPTFYQVDGLTTQMSVRWRTGW